MKKITLFLVAAVVVVGGVAVFSAFEAHIINVTAHIENALTVTPKEIKFGTVFPQEYVEEKLTIALSDSFKAEPRVDDVKYKIVQKLKPCPLQEGTIEPVDPTCVQDAAEATPENPTGWHYLSLCRFLSKLPNEQEAGDTGVPSYFHQDAAGNFCLEPTSEIALGSLSKLATDISDKWTIDLKVPPVAGYIGQDWPASCADWVVESNDKTYGCDLWIEVTEISLPGETPTPTATPPICGDQADVMLVLDRSGSIDSTELVTLKTAAHAFVTALNPDGGVHMGQSSFATYGTLDLQLTGDQAAINAAIDTLSSGGWTNLYEGLDLAQDELVSVRGRAIAPNVMVVVTDGNTNQPPDEANARAVAAAEAAADKAAGTEIYVVGVGGDVDATYLINNIATDASHYFSAGDFDDLQAILQALANCQPVPTP